MMTTSHPLKAIGLLISAMAILPLIDVIAKFLGREHIPVFQMVWARFFFGALFTLPFALKIGGAKVLKPALPLLHSARAAFLILGTAFFFSALKFLPVADTLAIYFVQPIIIVALSPWLLGEHVDLRRWVMVALGFAGVLIIIRPGIQAFNPGMLLALAAGACSAFYILVTRHITGKTDALLTTFHTSVIGAVVLTLLMPFIWKSVTTSQFLQLLLLGAIAIAGHYLITRAYDFAEASLLSPFNYTEMITAVILGWYFFADFPDAYTFLGVAILISCALYISWHERQKAIRFAPTGEVDYREP